VARSLSIPTILSFHNTHKPSTVIQNTHLRRLREYYARVSIPLAARYACFLTGCSCGTLDAVCQQFKLDPADRKKRVLPYGVEIPDLDSPATTTLRSHFDIAEDETILVHVGRFEVQKNHHGLLEIMQKLVAKRPRIRLFLVGDGPLRRQIEAEASAMHLDRHVLFLGIRDDVEQILREADIFVFPSCWEGFGMVVLEANAAGIPVVASDVPGLQESVVDRETGFLVSLAATDLFVDAIVRLIDDPDLRVRMGRAGRTRVLQEYTQRAASQALTTLYDESLPSRGTVKRGEQYPASSTS
jgi:glycosyltransferase involved in cell wall biosynthesis